MLTGDMLKVFRDLATHARSLELQGDALIGPYAAAPDRRPVSAEAPGIPALSASLFTYSAVIGGRRDAENQVYESAASIAFAVRSPILGST